MIEFSIVIPLYNKENSIKNTLESILIQNYQNFEIIVINDGSKDKSVEIVESFNDKRIKLYSKENGGRATAANLGIKKATNDWIAFIDADDLWKEYHLSEALRLIALYPQIKVFATSLIRTDKTYNKKETDTCYIIDDYFKTALKKRGIISSSTMIIHKECFENVGLYNEKYIRGQDLDLYARLGRKYKFGKSDKVTAIYRIEAENRSGNRKFYFPETELYDKFPFRMRGSERKYFLKLYFHVMRRLIRKLDIINFVYVFFRMFHL